MDKITKLSQAIRYGSTFIEESRKLMDKRDGQWKCGCAIGTAYLAVIGCQGEYPWSSAIFSALVVRFGVPQEVLLEVSEAHRREKMTRAQCADYLESLGY